MYACWTYSCVDCWLQRAVLSREINGLNIYLDLSTTTCCTRMPAELLQAPEVLNHIVGHRTTTAMSVLKSESSLLSKQTSETQ